MAKRQHSETAAVADDKEARREAKRLRKETQAIGNGEDTTHKKHEVQDDGDVGVAGGARRSKEERKALKRAKKDQEEAQTALEAAQDVVDNVDDPEADARAERKALKRAEKAARKAANTTGTSELSRPEATTVNGKTPTQEGHAQLLYEQDAALTALPQADIEAFIAERHLAIEDAQRQAYRPIVAFQYLPVDETQRAPFAGFANPTPIQAACWPYVLAGRDVIGVAETGSGKTLAFGVPCVRHISRLDKKRRKGIKACMVSPTRELALQIHEQLVKLAEPMGVKATVVYGGTNKDAQRETLKGTDIVIATPGRLNDFVQEGSIDLSRVDYLVLDEADRMLDTGFEQEVRRIISATPTEGRQTLMFTATWPQSVRELASAFMTDPVKVTIGDNASGELRANTRISQEVEVIEHSEKQGRLLQLLKQYQSGKKKNDRILVFCLYKKEAVRIETFIRNKGFNVGGIHGDLNQQKRIESLEAFKQGTVPLLVATDVAARGLDIPAVKLVINVTFPLTVDDYVHRIGRTGRAGQDGRAITLFTDAEKGLAGALTNVLKAANQPVPDELLKFGTTVKKKGKN